MSPAALLSSSELTIFLWNTWKTSDILWVLVFSDIIINIISIWVVSDTPCHHEWVKWHTWSVKTSKSTKPTSKRWGHFIACAHFRCSNAKKLYWTWVQTLVKSSSRKNCRIGIKIELWAWLSHESSVGNIENYKIRNYVNSERNLPRDAKLILDILTPVWKSIKYWWSPRSLIHSRFSLKTILVEKFEISDSETPTPKCSAPEICSAWKIAHFYDGDLT